MKARASGLLLGLLLLFGGASIAAAEDADKGAVLRTRAALFASQGLCDEALIVLERARSLAPQDAAAALLEGQCLFQAKRYAEAVVSLEDAVRLDPSSGEAALFLGMAQYHVGESDAAAETLERAEELLPDNAQASLYRGLALLDQAQHEEAAARLNRASTIDPSNVEPVASYYAALAYQSTGRTQEADAALRRVSELAPGTEWDRQAQAALAGGGAARSYQLRRWLVLRAGLSYDSNVALVGNDVARPDFVSGEADGRGEWAVEAGTEVFRNEKWGVGVLADYYGNAYFRETDFSQAFVRAGVWVDRLFGDSTVARLQPLFGASFYGYEDYLRFYGVLAEVFQDWGVAGSGTFFARYAYNDFLYPVLGSTSQLRSIRNRDGHDVRSGYDHAYPVTSSTTLEGGPFFRYYDAKGSEWDYAGGGLWLGVVQQLPWKLLGELSGSYAYDKYADPSTFLLPGEKIQDREDNVWTVHASLERPVFWDRLVATARWTYLNDDSNTDVFDYDRHIAGLYLSVAFGD